MRPNLTIEWTLPARRREGRKQLVAGGPVVGRVPRVTRLLALAIKLDGLVRQGVVRDYADVARLGLVSRARVTQIMNLLNLAPDIQEEILFLGVEGRPKIAERNLRRLSGLVGWDEQRQEWHRLRTLRNGNAL